ncbi:Hsp20/alpha crystallin family protein [Bacillus sp. FJAT-49731]|uniref:Hsp20/alpha crystallin family protein n=2 Tax=Lederbergia citrea TaxID=2833581 RepID=A0A942Z4U5_9BACI|nr:Hsp20/alpha crystallin family protein [Lederbergia citrea]MBS4203162.1 Hsp20/alpha crystallin family protein [Lederbergia citrea]MBS4222166.1 Hsp20/alpha crystallin family protein [Lederbergia citrea]
MNRLFSEQRPNRSVLQSIDDFFTSTQPFGGFSAELKENEKEYIVIAELPGTKKEHIEIEVLQQYVAISVKQRETITKEDKNNKIFQQKDMWKQMSRTVPLSKPIEQGKAVAKYEDGVLTITVPKKKGKKINID